MFAFIDEAGNSGTNVFDSLNVRFPGNCNCFSRSLSTLRGTTNLPVPKVPPHLTLVLLKFFCWPGARR